MTRTPNDNVDPNEILRKLRPHASDGYLEPGDDPRADAILRQITARDADASQMARRARRVVLLVAGLTVVGAGAAAAMIVTRSPRDTTVVSCFSSSDVKSAVQVLITPDVKRTAVEQCADLWSDGRISSDGAPQLVACVTDASLVAVVPGDESSCVAAGWGVAISPATEPIADRTGELTDTLSDRFVDQCMNAETAAETVDDVLAELGLGTWKVHDSTTNADWCAAPAVDTDTRTVNLISVPRVSD